MSSAFCPAHITGFFKAEVSESRVLYAGSLGAGFSISHGVRTDVTARRADTDDIRIITNHDDTTVSQCVAAKYAKLAPNHEVTIRHDIGVPVGYGLGCSAAVALSLSLALNDALDTRLSRQEAAQIAHAAEIECQTGLGDVSAALDGGFEIRTGAGAPGIGDIERTNSEAHIVLACFAPMSTREFISERIDTINGLGGRMVGELRESRTDDAFQDMSLRFARYIDVITPRMQRVIDDLARAGIRCGVALFGETIFAMTDEGGVARALEILEPYGAKTIHSRIDNFGARVE